MRSASHIEWNKLAEFAYRLKVMRAGTRDMRSYPRESQDEDFCEAVEMAYKKVADPNTPAIGRKPRLEEFFERSLMSLENASPLASAKQSAKQFRTALLVELNSPLCQNCAKTPCRGTKDSEVDDLKALSANGLCIKPVTMLFDLAYQISSKYYPNSAKLSFHTAYLNDHPGPPLQVAVDAKTTEDGDYSARKIVREIRLRLNIPKYSFRDYFATLYLLFHEIFCHGFSGTSNKDESVGDVFSDGWMDWVAAVTLERELVSPTLPSDVKIYARDMSVLAVELSSRRFSPTYSQGGFAEYLDTGRRAAQKLVGLMAGCLGSDIGAWDAFRNFSVAFCASNASDVLRADLVRDCNDLIDGWSPIDILMTTRKEVVEAVQKYLATAASSSRGSRQESVKLANTFSELRDSYFN